MYYLIYTPVSFLFKLIIVIYKRKEKGVLSYQIYTPVSFHFKVNYHHLKKREKVLYAFIVPDLHTRLVSFQS